MKGKWSTAVKLTVYVLLTIALGVYSRRIFYSFIFITIHELVHMVVGTCLGYGFEKARLLPYGTNAIIKEEFIRPMDDAVICISGPMMNFAFFCFFTYSPTTFIRDSAAIAKINLALCVFNMLPAGFLDGGRLFKCILKFYASFYLSYIFTICGGIVTGIVLVLGIVYYKLTINGIIIFSLGIYILVMALVDIKNISISIIRDEINKQGYLRSLKFTATADIIVQGNEKLLDVIKHFTFNRYYNIYVISFNKAYYILSERQIYMLYCSCGNITIDECVLIIKTQEV